MKGGEIVTEFEVAFDTNKELVFKFLVKLTNDAMLAEELTQETFFRAYMNYNSLKDKEKISTWLCQIAKNTYFAWYNETKRIEPFYDAERYVSDDNLEDIFVHKEQTKEALTKLHELEEPYKEVFMLSVFGGFSLREISSVFGKSESWARVTFYRAKQKILERMK